jgi:SAM-dependent methyltransferase
MPGSAYRRYVGAARDLARRARSRAWAASPARMDAEAQAYWDGGAGTRFRGDSHWKSGAPFKDGDLWERMGREHVALYERLRAASAHEPAKVRHMVDWGCGGGANAVTFAPLAERLTGVDVSRTSLDECARQMAALAPGVPFQPVLADISRPEQAAREAGPCELVICLYVLELVPSKEYGLRLMRVFRDLLVPGGQVLAQVKYATGSWRTASRRRSYRSDIAGVTYRVDEFWTAAEGLGLRPEAVTLVPRNELDERYAYFLLTRP